MKKILNTLFITNPKRYLSLDGENIVVQEGTTIVARLPIHNFESIVTLGYTGASPALMSACAKRGVTISFRSKSGRFLARVIGETNGNVVLRRQQYRTADDNMQSIGCDNI